MAEKKESFNAEKLKKSLQKEIDARSAKYWSDQVLATHQKNELLSITQYINTQEIENTLERIISQLGGGAREQGMVFVSVTDKDGCFVTSDSDCDKIIVSVAYGQEFIIKNREYPPEDNSGETTESPPTPKHTGMKTPGTETTQPGATSEPVERSDDKHIKTRRIQLAKELKRKLDELWTNRKGLGVDFYNPGALKIELIEDSPRIAKIVQEIGNGELDISIDRELGLIQVFYGGKIHLKWKYPEEQFST